MGPHLKTIQFADLPVAIVENEPLTQRMLQFKLQELGCRIVWAAKNEEQALAAIQTAVPRIVFVDLRLAQGQNHDHEQGWELIRALRQRRLGHPLTIIICAGTPVVDGIVLEAIQMGCSYIIKEDLWDKEDAILAGALLAAQVGAVFLSNEVAGSTHALLGRSQSSPLLSTQEMAVMELIALGFSNQQIGAKLVIAPSTVKSHVSSIFRKLEVKNRTQAADWYRNGSG
jgi:DNA-binding NarL/FixJ family response regulator